MKRFTERTKKISLRISLVLLVVIMGFTLTANSVYPQAQNNERIQNGTRFYVRDININGTKVVNYYLHNPLFIYRDSTYVPVSEAVGDILGFSYRVSKEEPYIFIEKKLPTATQLKEKIVKRGDEPITVTLRHDAMVFHGIPEDPLSSKGLDEMQLNGMPILQGDDKVFYLPLRAFMEDPTFDWDVYSDQNYGLCISTKEDITAKSLWSQKESKYNQGLAAYIRSRNNTISTSISEEYTFFFKNAARENGVEVEWTMAIAQCESRYRKDVVSKGGAIGMMQIMGATGRGYGLSKADLLNPKKNIDFGTMYYAQTLKGYKGNHIRALSGYQMGIGRENKGNYKPTYANTVMWARDNLLKYLKDNNYAN